MQLLGTEKGVQFILHFSTETHLAASLCNAHPIPMAWIPQSTLLRPNRFVPKKKGQPGMGTLPEMTLLVE